MKRPTQQQPSPANKPISPFARFWVGEWSIVLAVRSKRDAFRHVTVVRSSRSLRETQHDSGLLSMALRSLNVHWSACALFPMLASDGT